MFARFAGLNYAIFPAVFSSLILIGPGSARAQLPALPADHPAKGDPSGAAKPAPTPESPKAKIAATSGRIAVAEPVSDEAMRRTLDGLLRRYPGVRRVNISVESGFVTIDGQVDDDSTHDQITDFVRRVEGVRLVLNLMRTDDEVMSATALARREFTAVEMFFARKWLLLVFAAVAVLGAMALARLFGRYSEALLAPVVGNALLRSVLGSLLSALIIIGGLLSALSILDLTQAVLSILGLAGVAGLAVGFAFKDITENFIASVLLGVRRPFRVGDSVRVAGQSGVVQSLNTRATVLVTPEGKHVRIPNSVIYKEIMVNASASPRSRDEFPVLIPYEASTSEAIETMTDALRRQDGVLDDPAPRVLVDALETGGVRLRVTFWTPTQGIDGDKLLSDAKLKVKVALQERGILVTQFPVASPASIFAPATAARGAAANAGHPASPSAVPKAHANLRRDAEAAASTAPVADGRSCALSPGLLGAGTRVEDEGVNLLPNPHAGTNGTTS